MQVEQQPIDETTIEKNAQQLETLNEEQEAETIQDESNGEENAITEEVEASEDDDEITVTIGDKESERESKTAPDWVRELRKKNRQHVKEIRELREKLEAQAPQKTEALPPKPTLEACDWNASEYEEKLADWFKLKAEHDTKQQAAKEKEKAQEQQWQEKLDAYAEKKEKLSVKDYEDVEEHVFAVLNPVQRGIIVQGAENPAMVIYALGSNPGELERISKIEDPVQVAFEIARMEPTVKMERRTKPAPEKIVKGGKAVLSGVTDRTLERLYDKAAKTGDLSEVLAYKRKTNAT